LEDNFSRIHVTSHTRHYAFLEIPIYPNVP
jgi:hypothetical protein